MKRFQVIAFLALAAVAGIAYAVDPVSTAAVLPGIFDPASLTLTGLAIGATNFVQPGETITLAVPYDRASGQGMLVGNIFGVALGNGDFSDGDSVECALEGVWDILAVTANTFAVGDLVYWDDAAKKCTSTSSANTLIGAATAAKINGDTTVRVRLNGAFL